MADIRQLASQLHEIAWSAVRRPAADPWGGAAGTREERRTGSLELLAVYSQLVKVLQRRIDLTIKDALDAGADYGQIAAACGVSRQAVRQRWMRRTAGRDGTRYGCRIRGRGAGPAGRTAANLPVLSWCAWPAVRMTAAAISPPRVRS